jgi:hypothetical protein
MSCFTDRALPVLFLAAAVLACRCGALPCRPELKGSWLQVGRQCTETGACFIVEEKIHLTFRPDNSLILASKGSSARFILEGDVFYRAYAPEGTLSFCFEVVALSRETLVLRLYSAYLREEQCYTFRRIARTGLR